MSYFCTTQPIEELVDVQEVIDVAFQLLTRVSKREAVISRILDIGTEWSEATNVRCLMCRRDC